MLFVLIISCVNIKMSKYPLLLNMSCMIMVLTYNNTNIQKCSNFSLRTFPSAKKRKFVSLKSELVVMLYIYCVVCMVCFMIGHRVTLECTQICTYLTFLYQTLPTTTNMVVCNWIGQIQTAYVYGNTPSRVSQSGVKIIAISISWLYTYVYRNV